MTLLEPNKGKIIVFGIAFWYPLAGVTYQFLHYLLGLRRLGYDPYYIEDSGRWVYDPRINDLTGDAEGNIAAVVPVLEAHGFAGMSSSGFQVTTSMKREKWSSGAGPARPMVG